MCNKVNYTSSERIKWIVKTCGEPIRRDRIEWHSYPIAITLVDVGSNGAVSWKVRDVRPRSTIYASSQSCLRTRLSTRTLHIPAVEISRAVSSSCLSNRRSFYTYLLTLAHAAIGDSFIMDVRPASLLFNTASWIYINFLITRMRVYYAC